MHLALTVSLPTALAVGVTFAAWLWAFTRPVEVGGFLPDFSPIFYAAFALILTLAVWLARAGAAIWLGV